jgi:hypothetical protein
MMFLFLILFHLEIGIIADVWIYVSGTLVDALFGTLRNLSRCVPCCFTNQISCCGGTA